MNKITDKIYLGSSQDAQHRKVQLRASGVTAILNVARDLTNATTTHKEFKMFHVGLMDGGGNPPNMLVAAVEVLNALLLDGETVLIHCHEGKSRSALVLATYLTDWQRQFATLEEAEAHLQSIRARVVINPGLKELYNIAKPHLFPDPE